jgi:hypothetical protein
MRKRDESGAIVYPQLGVRSAQMPSDSLSRDKQIFRDPTIVQTRRDLLKNFSFPPGESGVVNRRGHQAYHVTHDLSVCP